MRVRDALLDTFAIVKDLLPNDTHPVHQERVKLIARLIYATLDNERVCDYWQKELDKVEPDTTHKTRW
jgi:hypothetical protein